MFSTLALKRNTEAKFAVYDVRVHLFLFIIRSFGLKKKKVITSFWVAL